MVIRVWVAAASRLTHRSGGRGPCLHHRGLPNIAWTRRPPEEVVAQMLLAANWHGYIDADEAVGIQAHSRRPSRSR